MNNLTKKDPLIWSLASDLISSFLVIARAKNLSRASEILGITQAALSLKLQRLEASVERTLFIRGRLGVELTEPGRIILKYAEAIEGLSYECNDELKLKNSNQVSGKMTIGVFSTIARSRVLPVISEFLLENPNVQVKVMTLEIYQLTQLLKSGEADLVFLDQDLNYLGGEANLEKLLVGHEQYVHICSKNKSLKDIPDIYINHDEEDLTSFRYFDFLGEKKENLQRLYFDEIYAVIDAVAIGLGKSVLPRHLIQNDKRIKILNPKKIMPMPIYLYYKKRPYYSKLFSKCIELFKQI